MSAERRAASGGPGVARVWRREWQRVLGDRRSHWLMLYLPVASAGLMLALFWTRTPRELPISVHDADDSALSRQLIRNLDATPALQVVHQARDLPDGRDSVLRGDVYALLAIPADYQRDVLRGAPRPSQFFYNTQLLTAGNLAARDARIAAGTLSLTQAIGRRVLAGQGAPTAIAAASPIATQLHALFNPSLDYARFLGLSVMAALLHIFAVVVGIDATAGELRRSTAGSWFEASGATPWKALAGKLALPWLWFSALGSGVILLSVWLLGVQIAGSAALLLLGWSFFVAASVALGAFLAGVTANLRVATSVSSLLISPALAFSGLTFPAVAFPSWVMAWSALLPLSHYLQLQLQQVSMATPAPAALTSLLALLPFAALPFLLLPRWASLLSQPEYWGRA